MVESLDADDLLNVQHWTKHIMLTRFFERMSTKSVLRSLRVFEMVVAVATLVSTYLTLAGYLWYPVVIWIGSVPFDTVPGIPAILSVVVVTVWWRSWNRSGKRLALAAAAVITFVFSAYTIGDEIVTPGGWSWAEFLPLYIGGLLAVLTLLVHLSEQFQRHRNSAPTGH